jgi:hypothetical protein
MTTLGIEPVSREGFSLSPILDGGRLIVRFSGNGDMEATSVLNEHLVVVHREAVIHQLNEVVFDFHDLYFLNSSCLKAFVSWIHTVDSEGVPYKIRFLSNPNQHWQRRSLDALHRLALDVVTIEQLAS